METEKKVEVPGYLISFTKQTGTLGEMVTIQTNLPVGSSAEQIGSEIAKLGSSLDERMRVLNAEVLKRTGKSLEDMGLVAKGLLERNK